MKFINFLLTAALVFSITALASGALAQDWVSNEACAERLEMAQTLVHKYNEHQLGIGIAMDEDTIYEMWASDETGTWTILRTYTNGIACVVAVGTDWVPGSPTEPAEPA